MSLRVTKKICISITLFAATTFVNASETQIHCPDTSVIRIAAHKINKAESVSLSAKAAYIAFTETSAFVESDLPWYIGVNGVYAKSEDKAIKTAIKMAKNTGYMKTKYGTEITKGTYLCEYGPGEIVAYGGKIG